METLITFTPAQLVAFIGALFAFIASIGAGVAVIVKMITKIRAPELKQNQRLDDLEKADAELRAEIEEIKKCRINDNDEFSDKFDGIEKAQKVILKSLQALLAQSLGVDATEALNDAKKELDNYLLDK